MATQRDVAAHLDLSDRHVRNLQKQAGWPRPRGRGDYDLDDCRLFYINYLRAQKEGSPEPETEGDTLLAELKLEKLQLELDEKRERIANVRHAREIKQKLYAPIYLITDAVIGVATAINSRMEGVLPRLKQAWPDMPIEAHAALHKELVAISNDLATVQPDLSNYLDGDTESDPQGAFGIEEENPTERS